MKKRVFSGIQPTGNLHIGNYLGAVKQWVASQEKYDNIFCIVDLHAITVPQDADSLNANIRNLASFLFASGIDPDESVLFVQSHIAAHSELAWILNCFTPLGWMERMTQFKEKAGTERERASVGLFAYPALMAADILLYDTHLVPVGEDQKQHLELTRDIVKRFNHRYGDTFVMPSPIIPKVAARVMGLDDPTKKMSKSEAGNYHALYVLDPPDVIRKKIKRAATDSLRDIRFDENHPGVNNLLGIYQAFTGETSDAIEAHFVGKGYGDLKKELAEVVIEGLRPIQTRYAEFNADPAQLDALLAKNADKIRPIAEQTMKRVQQKIGLG